MIDKLEMFLALSREEHFGRAAEKLGITQPSLSAGIKQLEAQLGVQLVSRGKRFGGLTPEGERTLEWARRIVDDVRGLKAEMRTTVRGLSGHLRIAAIPTALTEAARLTTAFAKAYPNVEITLLSRTSDEITEMLEALEIDCGVTYLDDAPTPRFTRQPMYVEDYVLIHSGSAPADQETVPWERLEGQPLCLLTSDMQNRRLLDQNFQASSIAPRATIESNSTLVLIAHVETGEWMTVLPKRLATFLTKGRALTVSPLAKPAISPTVGVTALKREPQTPLTAAFLTLASKQSEMS